MEDGIRWICPNQRRRRCRRRYDAVGCLVRSRMILLLMLLPEHSAGGAFDSACRTRLGAGDRRGWWPCSRVIEQNGDNQGTIHVDLSLYADGVFAKQWI